MEQSTNQTRNSTESDHEQTLDRRLQTLQDNKDRWATLPLAEKITMARTLLTNTAKVARRQVLSAARAKSIPKGSPLVGEEWLGGPSITIRNLRLLIDTLEEIESRGTPNMKDLTVRTREDGQ